MATTQTATVGQIRTPNPRAGLVAGIAVGALVVGTIGAWVAARDDGASQAASAGVSTYSLSKVLGTESNEIEPSLGVAPLPVPAASEASSYWPNKLQQAHQRGIDTANVASSGYTTAKIEQQPGESSGSVSGESTRPDQARTGESGAGISGSPHLPGLVE